jgi:formylglycine-generating enzyme required for sulfatase activity
MAQVFISYAREDERSAALLSQRLEERGWSVFWDQRIPSGRRFAEVISEEIASAKCVIVLWSLAGNASDWVLDEATEARQQSKLLPALIERVPPPIGFRQIHAADLTGWYGEESHHGFQGLVQDIRQYVLNTAEPGTPVGKALISTPTPTRSKWRSRVGSSWRWAYVAIPVLLVISLTWIVYKRVFVPPPSGQDHSTTEKPALPAPRAPKESAVETKMPQAVRPEAATSKVVRNTPGESHTNNRDSQPYVWISPGQFRMGCSPVDDDCEDNEKPSHLVKLTHGFWVGQTEVTQQAYKKLIGKNPSHAEGDDRPVEGVNWFDAERYCKLVGGRLPTEAEWEYAARAENGGRVYGAVDGIAWNIDNSGQETHGVALKKVNQWGLNDMLGNVKEWVSDWYDDHYYQTLPSLVIDPHGPLNGAGRVVRGGGFRDFVTLSQRNAFGPERRFSDVGFRCAIEMLH